MEGPPPPPPPHGANPNTTEGTPRGYRKSTDLPEGPYDIFVIPPHSAGAGFLYLPSLQCHRNSFLAGSLSTLAVVALWIAIHPMVKTWVSKTNAPGGIGIVLIVVAVGVAGWYFGTLQNEGRSSPGSSYRKPGPSAGFANGFQYSNGPQPTPGGAYAGGGPPPNGPYNNTGGHYNAGGTPQPPPFNNHGAQANGHSTQEKAQNDPPKDPPKEQPNKAEAEWERAREETKRKEEIRRKMEAYKRKREAEEAERRLKQEREAMEQELKRRKEELEREAAAAKAAAEKEVRERAAREAAEREERLRKEAAEREERLRKEEEERVEKARKEAEAKEAAAKEAAKKEAAARFAAAKEAAAKKFAAAKEAAAKAKEASQAPPAQPPPPPAPLQSATSAPPRSPSPRKPPAPPTAKTGGDVDDDAYSFRPYDRPRRPYGTSAPSVYSESSYAPSQSTARTTPPPSNRGPYMTKDPDKVIICGVYLFNNAFQKTPIAQLVSGQGSVTDGLVLRITTEGLFIDDDVRGVAQREWDVKAWTLKSIETIKIRGFQVVRASVRDQEGKRYVFILGEAEVWKVTQGFKKLKSGSQARHLSQSELSKNEATTYLTNLGY